MSRVILLKRILANRRNNFTTFFLILQVTFVNDRIDVLNFRASLLSSLVLPHNNYKRFKNEKIIKN